MPSTLRLTMVPGINGTDQAHWQTRWLATNPGRVAEFASTLVKEIQT